MNVDVSNYEPGIAVSKKMLVTECPICKLGCVMKGNKNRPDLQRFVHVFEVYRHIAKPEKGGKGTMRSKPAKFCKHPKEKKVTKRDLARAASAGRAA